MSDDLIVTRPIPAPPEPDAHGQAALLLAESTLHALIEAGVLTRIQGVEIVATAAEVKEDMAAEIGESAARLRQSLVLLDRIGRSVASLAGGTS